MFTICMDKITMNTPHETAPLLDHLMRYVPHRKLVALALRRGRPLHSEMGSIERDSVGPMISFDLPMGDLGNWASRVRDQLLEFVDDYDVLRLAIVTFYENYPRWSYDEFEAYALSLAQLVDAKLLNHAKAMSEEGVPAAEEVQEFWRTSLTLTNREWFRGWVWPTTKEEGLLIEAFHAEFEENGGAEKSFEDLASYQEGAYRDLETGRLIAEMVGIGSVPASDLKITAPPAFERPEGFKGYWFDSMKETYRRRRNGLRHDSRMWGRIISEVIPERIEMDKDKRQPIAEPVGLLNDASVVGSALGSLSQLWMRDRVILFAVHPEQDAVTNISESALLKRMAEASEMMPDFKKVQAVIDVLEFLSRYTDDDDPMPFATIAYLDWWRGQGSRAGVYAQLALERDPTCSLAQLVSEGLSVRLPPPWSDTYGDFIEENTEENEVLEE